MGMGGRSGIRDKVGPDLDFQPLLHFPSPLPAATTTVPGKGGMLCRGQLLCHRQSTEHPTSLPSPLCQMVALILEETITLTSDVKEKSAFSLNFT